MKRQIKKTAVLIIAAISLLVSCSRPADTVKESGSTGTAETEAVTISREGFVAEKVEKPIDRSGNKMRLGAYLWYGFVSTSGLTNRHMDEFYDYREPLWGYGYNDIEDMEFQIQLAYDYGLDFFAIDYYASINEGYGAVPADYFVEAKNSNLLDFCLLVVNADSATTPSQSTWDIAAKNYVHYMSRPNSLKIDGKPVIIFITPYILIDTMGGVENTKAALDDLEKRMTDLGYPGIVVIGCDSPYGDALGNIDYNESAFNKTVFTNRIDRYESAGFDAFSGYNYRQINKYVNEKGEQTYDTPYTYLAKTHENCWDAFSDYTDSLYMPALLGGWDDRPRETEIAGYSCYAADRTGEAFRDHILNSYKWITGNKDSALDNLAVIYAWDEIDEGGYIIPTKGEGFAMLEGMREAVEIINGKK